MCGAIGCSTAPPDTDFVRVIPQKYFPPQSRADGSYGWFPVHASEADGYRVEVGNRQYFSILNRVGVDHVDLVKAELARFAEGEVVKRGFCPSGMAHTEVPQLVGPRNAEYLWVGVVCVGK